MQRAVTLRRVVLLLAVMVVTCTKAVEEKPSPAGLWVWHEAWVSAPPEITRESGPQWSARAVVLRFCPSGRFRMATGVIYRHPGLMSLGSDDGLTIYEGRWSMPDGATEVRYHLADYEIPFRGIEQELKRELVERPLLASNALTFTYVNPATHGRFPMRFVRASSEADKLEPRFVECSAPLAKAPVR